MEDKEERREQIRENYSQVALKGTGGCCCSPGCCSSDSSSDVIATTKNLGYSEEDLQNMPHQANMGLGCGNPLAFASLQAGETVLDLGSGGGFDCFLACRQVGDSGHVIGVDMTPEMVKLARKNAEESGYKNVEFRLGEIEHLPVPNDVIDVIISNCVINLALDKHKVIKEAYRVLKPGGRIAISDVVATADIPDAIKDDFSSLASCIAGAEDVETIEKMLRNSGFTNIRMIPKDNSKSVIKGWLPGKNAEDFVASYIIEAQKSESRL